MSTSLLLGAHMSIAGGLEKSIEQGESIHCTAIQIFTKSSRQWKTTKLSDEQILLFKKAMHNSSIKYVVVHASYLINMGSPDHLTQEKSKAALEDELDRCQQLGIPYLIIHPGAKLESNKTTCLDQIAHILDLVFDAQPGHTMILLENTAGQGSTVGSTFEELEHIYTKARHKKRIGFCFDTCHAFAAGYDFREKDSYEKMWHQFDSIIGLEHLKALHLNDSKKGLGSHVDRHEEIGQGLLGLEPFRFIVNDKRFADIPKILETPRDTLEDYDRNMKTIRTLVEK